MRPVPARVEGTSRVDMALPWRYGNPEGGINACGHIAWVPDLGAGALGRSRFYGTGAGGVWPARMRRDKCERVDENSREPESA